MSVGLMCGHGVATGLPCVVCLRAQIATLTRERGEWQQRAYESQRDLADALCKGTEARTLAEQAQQDRASIGSTLDKARETWREQVATLLARCTKAESLAAQRRVALERIWSDWPTGMGENLAREVRHKARLLRISENDRLELDSLRTQLARVTQERDEARAQRDRLEARKWHTASPGELHRSDLGMRHSFKLVECPVCAFSVCRFAEVDHDHFTAIRHGMEQALAEKAQAMAERDSRPSPETVEKVRSLLTEVTERQFWTGSMEKCRAALALLTQGLDSGRGGVG